TQNEIDTAVAFASSTGENGVEFTLNAGRPMPCTVSLTVTGDNEQYTRLYLYNEATGPWHDLNSYARSGVAAETAERYRLANDTLPFIHMNIYALAAAGVVLVAIVVVYSAVKKRYWFW